MRLGEREYYKSPTYQLFKQRWNNSTLRWPQGKVLTTGAGSEFITKCSHGNRNLLSHEQRHPTEKFCSIQLRAHVDTTVQRNLAISGKTNDCSRLIVKSSNDENSFS